MQQMQLKSSLRACARPMASRTVAPISQSKRVVRASGGGQETAATAPVDFEELSDIIRLVNNTDIVELELKSKKFNLTVRKKEALKVAEPVIQMMAAPQMQYASPQMQMAAPHAAPAAPAAPSVAPAAAPTKVAAPAAPVAAGGVEMLSPMGGTFYRAPAPGEPMFCKEGDRVKKGQVVGVIEAMKLMNEVEAEMSGEIVKVLAENGKPITTGSPLFLIKP